MPSSRHLWLDCNYLYHLATVRFVFERAFKPLGMSIKTTERAKENLERDKLIRCVDKDGQRSVYRLTPKAARLRGLDERRYAGDVGKQTIAEHLSLLAFFSATGHELLSKERFAALFPEEAACTGMVHTRYFADTTLDQPILNLVTLDFGGADVRRIVRKTRKEIERRKRFKPWRVLIFDKLFAVTILTSSPQKAQLIRDALQHETFPHYVVVVPEMLEHCFRRNS